MPLIKARANRVRIVRHICRLQEPNRDTLVLYARFIGDTPDYVLNQLLATTIAKDRDFLAWQAEREAAAGRSSRRDVTVWVLNAAGVPESRQVDLGLVDDHFAELMSGSLQASDKVVVRSREAGSK